MHTIFRTVLLLQVVYTDEASLSQHDVRKNELGHDFGGHAMLDDNKMGTVQERMDEQVYRILLDKMLFLSELAPLSSCMQKTPDLATIIKSSQSDSQKHILEMIKKSIERNGKQDEETRIVMMLSKIVVETSLHPVVENICKSRIKEIALPLAKKMSRDTGNVMDMLRRKLDVSSPGFNDYLKSAISSMVKNLSLVQMYEEGSNKMEDHIPASSYVEAAHLAALKHMLEYLAILDSVMTISWGSESRSFDGTDITLTRPGFGVIVMVEPNEAIRRITDTYKDKLLMKTRDTSLMIGVFWMFIIFDKDYDCRSLPVNLLQVFNAYTDNVLGSEIKRIERDVKISEMHVTLTDELLLLGRDYPSHLAIKVEFKDVSIELENIKDKINRLGIKWMVAMAEELERHGFAGSTNNVMLSSNGWRLIIGYTANADYKTHVTLGVLRTGLKNVDRSLIRMNGNVTRKVDAVFSPSEGNPKLAMMSRRFSLNIERVKTKYLGRLRTSEMSGDGYSSIRSRVKMVKENLRSLRGMNRKRMEELGRHGLRSPSPDPQPLLALNRKEVDEWLRFEMSRFGNRMKSVGLSEQDRHVRVSRIHMGVINMNRIQNFEPINA